jgi:hypothetical protein
LGGKQQEGKGGKGEGMDMSKALYIYITCIYIYLFHTYMYENSIMKSTRQGGEIKENGGVDKFKYDIFDTL